MNIMESTISTRAIFHGDEHRLLLEKVWNKNLGKVAICMSNAGFMPSVYHMDYTTLFCINSLSALNYGSCSIVNLFSKMTNKLNLAGDLSDLTCPENNEQIINSAKKCDVFIWAVGSITSTYKKVSHYQDNLFRQLVPFKDKIHVIMDSAGKEGLHPLTPSLRNKPWELVPFALPLPTADKKKTEAEAEAEAETGSGKKATTGKPKKK